MDGPCDRTDLIKITLTRAERSDISEFRQQKGLAGPTSSRRSVDANAGIARDRKSRRTRTPQVHHPSRAVRAPPPRNLLCAWWWPPDHTQLEAPLVRASPARQEEEPDTRIRRVAITMRGYDRAQVKPEAGARQLACRREVASLDQRAGRRADRRPAPAAGVRQTTTAGLGNTDRAAAAQRRAETPQSQSQGQRQGADA